MGKATRCFLWPVFQSAIMLMLSYIPVPGANFVTRKISRSVAKIHLGQLDCFSLGNLDAKRDWGHARDYVEVSCGPHALFWIIFVVGIMLLPQFMIHGGLSQDFFAYKGLLTLCNSWLQSRGLSYIAVYPRHDLNRKINLWVYIPVLNSLGEETDYKLYLF